MSELDADARLLASLMDDPTFHVPVPPPADTPAKFAFHDGYLWRLNSSSGWHTCDDINPHSLLSAYRADAAADDWFAPKAAEYVRDLEAAMREAGMLTERKAA